MRMALRAFVVSLSAAVVLSGCSDPASDAPPPAKPMYGTWGVDLSDMDKAIKPGDDFFDYVEGNWVRKTQIPADRLCAGVSVEVQDRLDADLKAIVEKAAAENAPAGDISQQIGDMFSSFMDEATLDRKGVEPVRGLLTSVDIVTDPSGLAAALVSFNGKTGVDDPFPVSITIDPNRPDRYIPVIWQGGLSLQRDYYVTEDERSIEVRTEFLAHVARMLELAGYTDAPAQARQVLDLEKALARIQLPPEETRDVTKTNNIMTRAEVEKLGEGAPLAAMFDALKLPADTDFQVGMPDVLRGTAQLWATQPVPAWQAYMRYHVLSAYGGSLSKPFSDELFDFYGKQLSGREQRAPRDKRGVSLVSGSLGDPVGELYVKAHFAEQTKQQAEKLVGNVRKAYEKRINDADWMTPATKKQAQDKLAALMPKIGYPEKWESYKSVVIKPDDLVGNNNNLTVWSWDDDVSKLGKPIDRAEWSMTPQTNNAYYSSRLNDIVFPAARLQPPYFDPAADPAANYGAIGVTIAHEMSHAFDDQGRKSDATGMLRDWWTPADAERYDAQADKLVGQFDTYEPLPGLKIIGSLTLGENIADLAGVRIAYDAYKVSLGGQEAPVIDGLTGDQRFFLAYAQKWKEKCRPETERNLILSDPHSPSKFRVNGIVRNMDEWYTAFDVKPGEALYLPPEERVRVW